MLRNNVFKHGHCLAVIVFSEQEGQTAGGPPYSKTTAGKLGESPKGQMAQMHICEMRFCLAILWKQKLG
jgi:hypothetical protein